MIAIQTKIRRQRRRRSALLRARPLPTADNASRCLQRNGHIDDFSIPDHVPEADLMSEPDMPDHVDSDSDDDGDRDCASCDDGDRDPVSDLAAPCTSPLPTAGSSSGLCKPFAVGTFRGYNRSKLTGGCCCVDRPSHLLQDDEPNPLRNAVGDAVLATCAEDQLKGTTSGRGVDMCDAGQATPFDDQRGDDKNVDPEPVDVPAAVETSGLSSPTIKTQEVQDKGLMDMIGMLFEREAVPEAMVNTTTEPDWVDVEFEVALDSGCTDNVCHGGDVPGYLIETSPGSRCGQGFLVGNGERVPNTGQVHLSLQTDGDIQNGIKTIFQIAKVSRPLMSVGRLCDVGLQVVFDKDKARVLDKDGYEACCFERQAGGLYIARFRLKKPPPAVPFGRPGR